MSTSAPDQRARVAARISFVASAALALWVVLRCGYQYPYSDDWDLIVPILAGQRDLGLSWLWAQHNEHRLLIPKLVLIGADVLTGGDFRGAVMANWAMLVGVALLLYRWACHRINSVPWWTALLLSVLALSPSDNALRWGVETQFVTSAVLLVTAVTCATATTLSWVHVALAGLSSVVLPMTGGNGVLVSGFAAAATMYAAMRSRRVAPRWIAGVGTALTLVAITLYFVGYTRPTNHEALASHAASNVLIVFGHLVVAPFGPYASRAVFLSVPMAASALIVAVVIFRRAYRRDSAHAQTIVGVALVGGSSLVVFGAIALGRGARGWPPGLEAHYAPLGIPLWGILCAGLIVVGARTLPAILLTFAAAAFLLALPTGQRPPYVALGDSFHAEWCAGASTKVLADRYNDLFYYVDTPQSHSIVSAGLTAFRSRPLPAWRCGER